MIHTNPKPGKRSATFVIVCTVGFVMQLQSNSAIAQQPWKAIKKANNRLDRAIRSSQQADYRYSKRVYQQQQKMYRQNEKAVNRYYRQSVPATVFVPAESAPVVYGSPVVVSQVVTSPPISYSTYSESIYGQPRVINSTPIAPPMPTRILTNEWQRTPSVVSSPGGQIIDRGIIYSEPVNSHVYESAYPVSAPAVATMSPIQSESGYTVIESPIEPVGTTASESTKNEPTLAPIPDPKASAVDSNTKAN